MYANHADYLRAKLGGLKEKRSAVFEANGKKFVTLSNGKQVPAHFLERWIKETEIDLGLIAGRAMEDLS